MCHRELEAEFVRRGTRIPLVPTCWRCHRGRADNPAATCWCVLACGIAAMARQHPAPSRRPHSPSATLSPWTRPNDSTSAMDTSQKFDTARSACSILFRIQIDTKLNRQKENEHMQVNTHSVRPEYAQQTGHIHEHDILFQHRPGYLRLQRSSDVKGSTLIDCQTQFFKS